MTMDASGQFALAYALTTTAGLRGFLTLLAASLAAHYGWIHPAASFAWLGATSTMVVLALFTVIEFGADKVPAIDHALHAVSFAARPVAAAILVGGTVHTQFLTEDIVDELQLTVAPVFVGDSDAPRFVRDGIFPWNPARRAELGEVQKLGDVVLLRYALSSRFQEAERGNGC